MKDKIVLVPEFVDVVPRELKANALYISIRYRTVIHSCCCGCGNQVVTPLAPAQWKLIFDGQTVSLEPSIGNWSFPCRSHYWIEKNLVVWSDDWSEKRVAIARRKDATAVTKMFEAKHQTKTVRQASSLEKRPPDPIRHRLGDKIRKWFGGCSEMKDD